MSIPATTENVASPHCSDECGMNSQKPVLRDADITKFCAFVPGFDEIWDATR
jgi:hypothetical protein